MGSKKPFTFSWTHHGDYYKLVHDNWERIRTLKSEHDAIQQALKKKRKVSDDNAEQLAARNDMIGELALIVVIFSAFTLEAYINHYAITRLSRKYHTNYLDKLDLIAKWIVIPRLVAGKQLDPGSRAVQDLGWLVGLRNKLAHYKSKTITMHEIREADFLWHEDAERAIRTIKHIVSALKNIDRKAETDWIS